MRRLFPLLTFCVAAGVASACSPDIVIPTEDIPTGGVRLINALPDAPWGVGLDFRFIDNVENNAQWQVTFRNGPQTVGGVTAAALTEYKPARAGVRKFRIFPNDTTQAVASTVIEDSTITIVAGHNYSVIMMGLAANSTGPDAMRMTIIDETVPDPGAGKTSIRVLNTTGAAIDGRAWLVGTAVPATANTGWGAIPAYSASAYVTVDTGAYAFNVRGAGGANSLTCDGRSILGANAVTVAPGPFDAIPGTRASGSAVSAIVFPGSVPGSKSSQFTTTTGSANMAATATGFTAARSYLTDCFVVGQAINVTGYTNAANNGAATITSIADGPTTGSTSLSASATGYDRAAGSFITNGFAVGGWVTAAGFTTAANNGVSQITAVTATSLTVAKTGGTVVEAAATGRSVVGFGVLNVSKVTVPENPAAGRTIIVTPNPVGQGFVWDRRPVRPVGV